MSILHSLIHNPQSIHLSLFNLTPKILNLLNKPYKAPKGHKEATVKGKAATCSAEGLTDGKECSVCKAVLVKQEKIAKNPDAHTEKLIDTFGNITYTTTDIS